MTYRGRLAGAALDVLEREPLDVESLITKAWAGGAEGVHIG